MSMGAPYQILNWSVTPEEYASMQDLINGTFAFNFDSSGNGFEIYRHYPGGSYIWPWDAITVTLKCDGGHQIGGNLCKGDYVAFDALRYVRIFSGNFGLNGITNYCSSGVLDESTTNAHVVFGPLTTCGAFYPSGGQPTADYFLNVRIYF